MSLIKHHYMLETPEYLMSLFMEQHMSAVNQQEIGWLCGIIDTDGTTSLDNDIRWSTIRPRLSIANTNPIILDRVIELFRLLKVPYYVLTFKPKSAREKPVTHISVSGFKRVSRIPDQITPILKQWELEMVRLITAYKLQVGKGARDEHLNMLIEDYRKNRTAYRRDPQRLNVMLSEKNAQFLTGWLAGVIDGDGAIMLVNNSPTANGKTSIRPCIVITAEYETFANAVLMVVEALGCTGYVQKKGNGSGTIYHVIVSNRSRAYPLLEVIRPSLVGKQRQADLVMEFCEMRSSADYNAPYSDREYELQRLVKALNNRGPEMMI